MKKNLISLILLILSLNCFSQDFQLLLNDQKIIDSLKSIVTHTKSDSLKCIVNFKLSLIYGKNGNQELHKIHLNSANKLIKKKTYLQDISYYYNAINLELSNETIIKLQRANNKLKKYPTLEIYSIRTKILSNIGLYHQRQNQTLNAIKILTTEAIPLAKKAKNNQELAFIYKLIALVFYNNDDIAKAENYLSLSIKTLEEKSINKIGYEKDLIETYLFYTEVLSVQKKIKEAEVFLAKAKKRLKKNLLPNLYIEYYFAEGALLHEKKDYLKELEVYDKGSTLAKSSNNYFAHIRFNLLKFEILKFQKKYIEARDLLLKSLQDEHINIEDKAQYSRELSWIYEQLNDYTNALKYSNNFITINDSLITVSYKNEIADLEAKYKNKEKESKIKYLKNQNYSIELKAQNNRLKYSIFAITTAVLIILIVFILLYQQKKNQLAQEKDIKNKRTINLLKNEKEVEIMQAIINGEELERKRLARELHDGIGSKLSALKIMLSHLEPISLKSPEVTRINELLGSSIKELREVSYNLVPESLLSLGLENALSDFCHFLQSDTLKIEFQSIGYFENIPVASQINIYRIVQELINNAVKHSECDAILVSCSQNENTFYITVEDNGKGFSVENSNSSSGLGLKNLKSRVEILNGVFHIESNATGTYFNIELNLASS